MKKKLILLTIFCLFAKSVFAANEVTLEAEDSDLYGVTLGEDEKGFTGTGYVSFKTHDQSIIEISADVENEGNYCMFLRVLNRRDYAEDGTPFPEKIRSVQIELDEEDEPVIISSQRLPVADNFTEILVNSVFNLNKGENNFYITSLHGGWQLDSIKIVPATDELIARTKPEVNPVNKNSSENVKKVLSYLIEMQGKGIISGQQIYNRSMPEIKAVKEVTGKEPALLGIDLIDYSPTRVQYGTNGVVANNAIKWWKEGGLVSCCWHWNAPMDLINKDEQYKHWYDGFRTQATTFDFPSALNDKNSEGYRAIIRDIDAIAVPLKKMQEAGVVLLWRPLHEASGGWFWWGAHDSDAYIKLYRLVYERLTDYHKLNNLIWVWNGQSEYWYPGEDVVDIISDDIYPPKKKYLCHETEYSAMRASSVKPKLVALSENGTLPDVEKLSEKHSYWSWFCTWNDEFCIDGKKKYSSEYTEAKTLKKYYESQYVITRDELPSFVEKEKVLSEKTSSEQNKVISVNKNAQSKKEEIKSLNGTEYIRLERVMNKIKKGEDVTIAAFGGSITTGYNSNPINKNSWAAITGQWFKDKAKEYNCNLKFMNEGVSGTDSVFGSVRVQDHLLNNKVDFVFLEFAMNDQWLEKEVRNRSYEGVIRQIENNSETGIMALFVNERFGSQSGQQSEQQPICEYYDIPYVSWKDCAKEEYGQNVNWDQWFDGQEGIHPSNKGHAKIAEYITARLEKIWTSLPEENNLRDVNKELPVPFSKLNYEKVTFFTNENITPLTNTGWENSSPVHPEWVSHGNAKQGWSTTKEGAELTFKIKAHGINVLYSESDSFRDCEAFVECTDGTKGAKVKMACAQASRKGYLGWAAHEVVCGEEEKEYILHVTCPKRRKTDQGKPCNIIGFIVY